MAGWRNPFAAADSKAVGGPQPQPRQEQTRQEPNRQENKSGTVPEGDKGTKGPKQAQSGDDPMLNFESLWQPDMDEKGVPKVKTDNSKKSYLPQIDAKKFEEMVGKMDFTRDFTPEHIEAVKGGGDGAVSALAAMMNGVGRRAFTSSFAAANKLSEQGFSAARDRFMSEVPDHVRDLMVDNELSGSAEYSKNPALAPIVSSVKKQYLQKFPKATAGEINTAVNQYFAYLGKELNKPKGDQNSEQTDNAKKLRRGDGDADFMDWIAKEVGEVGDSPFAGRDDPNGNPDLESQ